MVGITDIPDLSELTRATRAHPHSKQRAAFDSISWSNRTADEDLLATDLPEMYSRLKSAGRSFHERTVPNLGLHQVFFNDPSGVTIELNFPAKVELAASTAPVASRENSAVGIQKGNG